MFSLVHILTLNAPIRCAPGFCEFRQFEEDSERSPWHQEAELLGEKLVGQSNLMEMSTATNSAKFQHPHLQISYRRIVLLTFKFSVVKVIYTLYRE